MGYLGGIFRGALALKLPIRFNPCDLRRDLESIAPKLWRLHPAEYTDGYYEAVSLLSPWGRPQNIVYRIRQDNPFVPTSVYRRCPHLRSAIEMFTGRKYRARLVKLRAGGCILPHRDKGIVAGKEILRIHIPIITNPGVYILVDRYRVMMQPGESWCINITRPHEVYNLGDADRTHLVVDMEPDAATAKLLRTSELIMPKGRSLTTGDISRRYLAGRKTVDLSSASLSSHARRLRTAAYLLKRLLDSGHGKHATRLP